MHNNRIIITQTRRSKMKKVTNLIVFIAMATMMYAQCDVQGNFRVTALDVQYYDIARQTTDVKVRDIYGLGGTDCEGGPPCYVYLTLLTINAGDMFYGTHSGPYNSAIIDAVGINLNVNFNEDCTAALAEGSFYPDVNEENCVSSVQILPITDDMSFTSDQSAAGQTPLPTTNLIGIPSMSQRAYTGGTYGGLSLDEALIFDYFPQGNMAYMNQYGPDLQYGTGDEWAPVSIPTQINFPAIGENDAFTFPANAPLPGMHGGWISIGDVGASQIGGSYATVGGNEIWVEPNATFPDGFAEWHAIDGYASESGLGDFIGADEDGFDGDFDRTFGLPVLPEATYFTGNAGCEAAGAWATDLGSIAVAGDVSGPLTDGVTAGCYGQVVDGIVAQCDAAGSPQAAVTGLCVGASQGDDFAAGCAAYGAAASVTAACSSLGFDDETCAAAGQQGADAVDYYCDQLSGVDGLGCAAAGIDPCAVLTNIEFATGLCGVLAGSLVESETCVEWAGSFDNDFLNEQAVGLIGIDCPTAGAGWAANCIAAVDVATDVWVMDPSGALAAWSNFATWNGSAAAAGIEAGIGGCMAQGLDYDTCLGMVMADPTIQYLLTTDDSGSEFDPTCMGDGDFSDCSGRLVFHFDPTCIPEIEVRQVVIEFNELGGECLANGDANEDGDVNVLDVVGVVQAILGNGTLSDGGACNADFNQDGSLNVLDVVGIVQSILGNRATSASAVEIIKSSEGVSFVADGYVGGIQMTINHGDDFSIEMTDEAMVADYRTEGNSTTMMVVNPESDELFVAEGDFTIETVVAAANGAYIDISVPTAFSVSNAYPNPFNPTTSLNINLDAASHVSVKVFNVMGQLVDVVTEGQMAEGTHAISWDASTVASGVYFVNTEVGSSLSSQKVMLLK